MLVGLVGNKFAGMECSFLNSALDELDRRDAVECQQRERIAMLEKEIDRLRLMLANPAGA
jgi:hypothetical protein